MTDAVSLRRRAELCLRMAMQVSDPTEAGLLRIKAAEHFDRAVEIETQIGSSARKKPDAIDR